MFDFLKSGARWPECGDLKDWDTSQRTDLGHAFQDFDKWNFSDFDPEAFHDVIHGTGCPMCDDLRDMDIVRTVDGRDL